MERFLPKMRNTGKELETFSILGPFFRMSTLPMGHNIKESDIFGDNLLEADSTREVEFVNKIRAPLRMVQVSSSGMACC